MIIAFVIIVVIIIIFFFSLSKKKTEEPKIKAFCSPSSAKESTALKDVISKMYDPTKSCDAKGCNFVHNGTRKEESKRVVLGLRNFADDIIEKFHKFYVLENKRMGNQSTDSARFCKTLAKMLEKHYRPHMISEILPGKNGTATSFFLKTKSKCTDVLGMCLREYNVSNLTKENYEESALHDDILLKFVLIHELCHVALDNHDSIKDKKDIVRRFGLYGTAPDHNILFLVAFATFLEFLKQQGIYDSSMYMGTYKYCGKITLTKKDFNQTPLYLISQDKFNLFRDNYKLDKLIKASE